MAPSGSVVTVIAISEEWGYGEDHFFSEEVLA
jgi:hypothetical protein